MLTSGESECSPIGILLHLIDRGSQSEDMPFIIVTGLPCSGKTSRTTQVKEYFEREHDVKVHIVSDHSEQVDRNVVYAESRNEKDVRANLKSAVQRCINKEHLVILDSLNYIKGYRYELYCVTKLCQTPQCVIHCDINKSVASEWNMNRPQEEQYSQEVFDALVMRYEAPESRNRWDSPLFLVHPEDTLPCEDIYNVLYKRKAPTPNQSTQSLPLSSTNFLHELDKMTQSAVSVILDVQKTCVPGDQIAIPPASEKLEFHKHRTLAELQRMRRQFISFAKTRPVEEATTMANMFVQFMNNSPR